MKKFLALVAVLAILMCLAVPAFADSGNSPSGGGSGTGGSGSGTGTGSGGSGSGTTTSPQTGFDSTVWVVTTSGLLLSAGYCFMRAKKVSE